MVWNESDPVVLTSSGNMVPKLEGAVLYDFDLYRKNNVYGRDSFADKMALQVKRLRSMGAVEEYVEAHPSLKGKEKELLEIHNRNLQERPDMDGLRSLLKIEKMLDSDRNERVLGAFGEVPFKEARIDLDKLSRVLKDVYPFPPNTQDPQTYFIVERKDECLRFCSSRLEDSEVVRRRSFDRILGYYEKANKVLPENRLSAEEKEDVYRRYISKNPSNMSFTPERVFDKKSYGKYLNRYNEISNINDNLICMQVLGKEGLVDFLRNGAGKDMAKDADRQVQVMGNMVTHCADRFESGKVSDEEAYRFVLDRVVPVMSAEQVSVFNMSLDSFMKSRKLRDEMPVEIVFDNGRNSERSQNRQSVDKRRLNRILGMG